MTPISLGISLMIEKIEASFSFFFFPIKQLFIKIATLLVKILVKNLDTFRMEAACQKDQILTGSVAISAPLSQPLRGEANPEKAEKPHTHLPPHFTLHTCSIWLFLSCSIYNKLARVTKVLS